MRREEFQLQADNPDHGILEVQAHTFTLEEADCGEITGIAGRYREQPEPGASAVYNFKVDPAGTDASVVAVSATYLTPLHVPFHSPRDVQRVSRGKREQALLAARDQQARLPKRPAASA